MEAPARRMLQRELEYACLRKKAGLRFLEFDFPCTPEYFLALEVSSRMDWAGDDRLSLTTGPDFKAAQLALSATAMHWDVDAERAGKRGAAASGFKVVHQRMQDDQRPNGKATYVRYCLETSKMHVGVAVAQLDSAFKHVPESAILPPAPQLPRGSRIRHKWSPSLDKWIPRSEPDGTTAAARSRYRHQPWPWWG